MSYTAFESAPKAAQLTWLTWATRDIGPFVREFEAVSGDSRDTLAPVSLNNTGQQILARRAYYERFAYNLTLPDGSFDLPRARKIMYASTYFAGYGPETSVTNIIQEMGTVDKAIPVDSQALKGFISTDNVVMKLGKPYGSTVDNSTPAKAESLAFTDASKADRQIVAYFAPAKDYLGKSITMMLTCELISPTYPLVY